MEQTITDNVPAIMRKSSFARLMGITPGAVASAVKTGAISLTRDKMVNTRHPKNMRYMYECRARKEKTAKGQSEENKKIAKNTTVNVDTIDLPTKDQRSDADKLAEMEAADQFKADYQIAKLQAQTKHLEIKNAAALKLLIKRQFVEQAIGRISSVLANHMLTMGDRVSAECAATCGALTPENKIAVKQIIDKDTTRSINALKLEIQKEYKNRVESHG